MNHKKFYTMYNMFSTKATYCPNIIIVHVLNHSQMLKKITIFQNFHILAKMEVQCLAKTNNLGKNICWTKMKRYNPLILNLRMVNVKKNGRSVYVDSPI
jgi:hypothetical protein